MEFKKEPAIYLITCITNNKRYIGSTVNMYKRWVTHRSYLNGNKHPNIHLQQDWNSFGEDNFKIEVIDKVPKDLLRQQEEFLVNELGPEYNIIKEANRGNIRTNHHKEQIKLANSNRTKEQREKMANKCAKTYYFLSPENKEVKIVNLKKFCRENQFDLSGMLKVAKGKAKSYKGWKKPAI